MLNVRINTPQSPNLSPKIMVVGVGGAGGNAVSNMISSGLGGCDFLICNTDAQALNNSCCEDRIQIGANVTGGLGSGSRPEVGKKAAEETIDEVMNHIGDANMVFITAGMGGGTGTGAAPVIAKACRERGILTVGVVTKPFHFEGRYRMKMAESGIEQMQNFVDTLIVIPNQNLFIVANEKTTFSDAFKMADSVLQSAVRGVTDLMVLPGIVNLDFEDIRSAMSEMGKAMMGTGEAEGENRAKEAAEAAINNPLLDDVTMKGAKGVIINVTGGHDLTLFDIDEACNRIGEEVAPDANIIFGSALDESLEGRMRVSVVATGINAEEMEKTAGNSGVTGGMRSRVRGTTIQTSVEAQPAKEDAAENSVGEEQSREEQQHDEKGEDTAPAAVSHGYIPRRQTAPFAQMGKPFVPLARKRTLMNDTVSDENETAQESESFIPPSPVVPERQTPDTPVAYGSAVDTQSGSGQVQEEKAEETGYDLRPPARNVRETDTLSETRKAPSLFERITGNRRTVPNEGATISTGLHATRRGAVQGDEGQSPAEEDTSRSVQETPSQGRLNIDSPSAPAKRVDEEDRLDIPAFLRRQAN